MIATQILQKMKAESENLMAQLNSDNSRIYQITADGKITERTTELRAYLQRMAQQLQRVTERLSKTRVALPAVVVGRQ